VTRDVSLVTLPFVLAFLASMLNNLVIHSFWHLPGWLERFGAGELQVGVIMSTMPGAAIAARPMIGRLIDSQGRRRVGLWGASIHLVACTLYLTVTGLGPWLYLVRILHGVGQACLFSVLFTVAADVVPEHRRTQGLALFGISGMASVSLGPLLGELILARADYAMLFHANVAIAVGVVLALWKIPESGPPAGEQQASRGFFVALADPSLRPLWLIGLGFALSASSYFNFLKWFVLTTGVGTIGMFFTAYAVSAITLRLTLGWLPDRVGRERTLIPAVLSLTLGLATVAQASSSAGLVLAGALCGVGHGYAFPIISALVVSRARTSERGAAVAIFTALFDTGMLGGGPLLGAIAEVNGSRAPFVAAACIAAVSVATFAVWDRRAICASAR
jgi:MFS family permease